MQKENDFVVENSMKQGLYRHQNNGEPKGVVFI